MRNLFAIITRGAIGLLMVVLLSSAAQAANTADISVTVTILSVSVAVTSGSPVAFGVVAASSTTRSTVAAVITNDGNVSETYSLSLTEPVAWTYHPTTPGANVYVLSAMFSTAAPGATFGAEDALTTTPDPCTATTFGNGTAGQSGLTVASTAARNLWLQFAAPTSTSSYTQQTITVTITAAAS